MNLPITITHGDNEVIQFEVPSSTTSERYTVTWDIDNGWLCDCKGCLKGKHLCKHIVACINYMKYINMSLHDDHEIYEVA